MARERQLEALIWRRIELNWREETGEAESKKRPSCRKEAEVEGSSSRARKQAKALQDSVKQASKQPQGTRQACGTSG